MRTLFLLLLFNVFFQVGVKTQSAAIDAAVTLYEENHFKQALELLETFDQAALSTLQRARVQCFLAECYFEQENAKNAEKYFLLAEENFANLSSIQQRVDFAYRILQGRVATCSSKEERIAYRERLIELVAAQENPTVKALSAVAFAKGSQQWDEENYQLAVQHFQASATLLEHLKVDLDLASAYNGLAECYHRIYDFPRAVAVQEAALKSTPPTSTNFYFRNYINLAGLYLDLRKIETAREKLIEVRDFAMKNCAPDASRWPYWYATKFELHNVLIELDSLSTTIAGQTAFYQRYPHRKADRSYQGYLNRYAGMHIRNQQFKLARPLLEEALGLYESIANFDADAYNTAAFLFTKVICEGGEYERAIGIMQQLICEYTLVDWDDCNSRSVDFLFEPDSLQHSITLIEYLKDKASYYNYWDTKVKKDSLLELSNRHVQLADQLIARAKARNFQPGLHRQLDEISLELRKVEMGNLYRLYGRNPIQREQFTEAAFQTSEKVKQLIVSERLHQAILTRDFGLPTQLIQDERYYIRKIHELLGQLEMAPKDSLKVYENQLSQWRDRQDIHREALRKEYPAFFNLLFDPPPLSIKEVRDNIIAKNDALLQFLERDSLVYVVVITKEDLQFIQLKLDAPLQEVIPPLISQLEDYSPAVYPILRALHRQLLEPLLSIIGQKDLVIIPDGNLWYVPFAALLTKEEATTTATRNRSYLIQERNIRYLISGRVAALQQRTTYNGQDAPKGILCMSPLTKNNIGNFDRLAGSEETLQLLQSITHKRNDHYLEAGAATVDAFRRLAPGAALLHIDTHADINNRRPDASFLVFSGDTTSSDYQLKAADIFHLKLSAVLAVLSACRTAKGEIYRGQGVANLARAFAHAGCRNLLVNLWEIKDETARDLMKTFYPAILESATPAAAAFCTAQRTYLKEAGMNAHPGFWATGIYIGNDEVIELGNKTPAFLYILLAAVALCFCVFQLFRLLGNA